MNTDKPCCQYRHPTGFPPIDYCRHSAVHSRDSFVMAAICSHCTLRTVRCDRPREIPGPFPSSPFGSMGHPRSLPGRMAVVTCYFNPCGYRSLKTNYLRFAAGLRERRIALYTMELAFGDQPFFLEPGEGICQVRAEDVLWQKERMLNRLLFDFPRLKSSVYSSADIRSGRSIARSPGHRQVPLRSFGLPDSIRGGTDESCWRNQPWR
jgi:hypothetical protein